MKRNKNPNIIYVPDALELLKAYGFEAIEFNHYQIRMWHDETKHMYDWYHTTGTLCAFPHGQCRKVQKILDAEAVALHINKFESQFI